jgi:UDP:flavonoid glycosyltransferase YjiC (YdhE family)
MASVLLGWVLGAGLGHVQILVPLVHRLRAQGHDTVLAIWEPDRVRSYLQSEGVRAVPAPGPTISPDNKHLQRSFTSTLWTSGFSDADALYREVAGWDAIIDRVRPDVVLAETAPALQLACFGRVPTILVGTSFTVPPHHLEEFPTLFEGGRQFATSRQVLDVIAEVQRRRGREAPSTLPGLWGLPGSIYGVRELDLYRAVRPEHELGRPTSLDLRPIEVSATELRPNVFAYLTTRHRNLPTVLGVLGRSGVPVQAYCRGLDDAMRSLAADYGIELHDRPQDLASLLPGVSLVAHHGGLGTCQAALSLGRPQLLLPWHGEQRLHAEALTEIGCARFLHVPDQQFPGQLEELVPAVLRDLEALDRAALAAANTIHEREQQGAEDRVFELLEDVLA